MRNYISTVFLRVAAHADDGGGGTFDTVVYGAGGDIPSLDENIRQAKFNLEQGFPTYTFTYTPGPPVTAYWLFDKTNVVKFAQFLASYFYPVCIEVVGPPELGIFHPISDPLAPDLKPRKGWKDDIGTVRSPPPSEGGKGVPKQDLSGAGQLIKNFLELMRILIASVKGKRDNQSKRLFVFYTNELNAFLVGRKSITTILAEIHKGI